MDLDFSSLWSWTIPLWGLFVIVMFLCGVLLEPVVLQGISPVEQKGGAKPKAAKRVQFSLP